MVVRLDLTIEESRRLVPHQNATTMQVAISVVAATMWMIENPQEGVKVPDELPAAPAAIQSTGLVDLR